MSLFLLVKCKHISRNHFNSMHVLFSQRSSILESKPPLCMCSCHLRQGIQEENGPVIVWPVPHFSSHWCVHSPRQPVLTQAVEAVSKLGLKENPDLLLDTSAHREYKRGRAQTMSRTAAYYLHASPELTPTLKIKFFSIFLKILRHLILTFQGEIYLPNTF